MNIDPKIIEIKKKIYRAKAEEVIANLKKRYIEGIYCADQEEVKSEVLKRIPDNSVVALGGSETIKEVGILDILRKMNIKLLDRYREGITKEEIDKMRIQGLTADVFIASCNAITSDGKLVNEDGLGNRVASIINGPKKVILIVGINKLVARLEDAVSRIKNIVAPLNSLRVKTDTPCSKVGFCREAECFPPNRICSQLVIIESSMVKDRITVIIVGEELGF